MIQTNLFEALTEIGIKPESARRVERSVESAIIQGQEELRSEIREQQSQLMTKADGQALKGDLRAEMHAVADDLRNAMNEQTWRLVTFVIAANGLMLAAFKLIG